jgi:hypothetical protein
MKFDVSKLRQLSKLKRLKKITVKKESATKVALVAFTVATAGAIGFLMQSGSPLEASAVEEPRNKLIAKSIDTGLDANVLMGRNDADNALPEMPMERYAEASLPAQPIILTVASEVPVASMPKEENVPLLGCDINVAATPAVAAMVNLSVSASCLPGDRVTISHAGLTFTEVLDADGVLEISVPAMSMDAQFDVTFPNGYAASTTADVGSLQFYDRVAVQWVGETGLQIHALEFGATYGEEGHGWFGNDRDLTAVIGGRGGFLMRLGDGFSEVSHMADVYTFPTVNAAEAGDVQLTVEAEVNGANCGRAISATTLQVKPGADPIKKTLNVEIPACSATGDFLVLQNLLQDLTFAQKG